MKRSFLWDRRGRWEETFQKKTVFTVTKNLAHFSSYYRVWQPSRNNLQECTSSSYHYCIKSRSNFSGPKRLLKTQNFEKKRQKFQWKKMIRQVFLVLSGVISPKKHFKRVHTPFLLLQFNLYLHFFKTSEVVENKLFWKKRQTFRWRKNVGLFFSVLSNMKNVKKQFIRVHKVFLTFIVQIIRSFLGT